MKIILYTYIDDVLISTDNVSRFLTRNFYQFLYSQNCASDSSYQISSGFSSLNSIGFDYNNNEVIDASARYALNNLHNANQQTKLVLGSDATPFSVYDIELIGLYNNNPPIFPGVLIATDQYNDQGLTVVNQSIEFTLVRDWTNVISSDLPINEFGLIDTNNLLLLRYVYRNTILVPPGSVIKIKLQFNNG